MQTLIQKGALPEDAAEFLKMLVRAKYNLLISGGTSSGKTTFLNALSQYIPEDERVITIEDSAELQIQGIKNLVRLETRNANMEGVQPVTIRDLIRTALRMRPDRRLVGKPDFITINRFRNRVKNEINEVFTQTVLLLSSKGFISLNVEYIDGTKIESKANKYTFVWRKTVERNRERLMKKIHILLGQIDNVIAQEKIIGMQ